MGHIGQLGGTLFLFGAGSMVLNFLDREFVILAWIDNWGPDVGWAIRGGMAVGGAVLWLVGQVATGGQSND